MQPPTNDPDSFGRRPRHGAQGLPSDIGGAAGHGDRGRGWERTRGGGTRREAPSGRGGDGRRDAGIERHRSYRRLIASSPRTRVLALSMHKDSVYVREILRAGARGYLLKESIDSDLVNAVRAVAKGDGYLSPGVSDAVLSDYRRHVTDPLDLLTSREREVLQMIAEGKTNKEIATSLELSVYTVEAHRGRVMEKLNLHSTGELVRFALRNGLID